MNAELIMTETIESLQAKNAKQNLTSNVSTIYARKTSLCVSSVTSLCALW